MPKGWASLAARGLFTGAWRPVPLCYFSLLRQRKVTKRKASPARTAVLSGRHVDAGFGAWPPPTLRAWPAPDGARASHERAPTLRSVPPAVGLVQVASLLHGGRLRRWKSVPPAVLLMRIATLAHRGRLRRSSALYPPSAFRHHLFCSAIRILIIQTRAKYLIVNIHTSCVRNTAAGAHPCKSEASCTNQPPEAPIPCAKGALNTRRRHRPQRRTRVLTGGARQLFHGVGQARRVRGGLAPKRQPYAVR